jgi:hypothetical protein
LSEVVIRQFRLAHLVSILVKAAKFHLNQIMPVP